MCNNNFNICSKLLNKGISVFGFDGVADTVQDIEHTRSRRSTSNPPNANSPAAYWLVLPDVFGFLILSRMLFCCGGVYASFRVFSGAHLYLFRLLVFVTCTYLMTELRTSSPTH
jgi:hypothetical protein